MGFLVKIIPQDHTDIGGYYAGRIIHYHTESVAVPLHTDDKDLAKVYKLRKNAEKAVDIILNKSSFVTECAIEEV